MSELKRTAKQPIAWVWVHLGLRNQLSTAKYYSIEDAKALVSPASPVVVIENDGVARAHPDAQMMRPHLGGNAEGLKQEETPFPIAVDFSKENPAQRRGWL